MDFRKFLNELFQGKDENHMINIWTRPDKKSHFYRNIDSAADFINGILPKHSPEIEIEHIPDSDKKDIYFSCGLMSKKPKTGRGKKEDISGMPGFYADIDTKTADKEECPPTIEEAVELAEGFGILPTMIISSGHGIQPWWLFSEPWMFADDNDRGLFESLNAGLQASIRARAQEKDWQVDSVQDVTRVLRPPGTFNWKDKTDPKAVYLLKNSGARLADPKDIEPFLIDITATPTNIPAIDTTSAKKFQTNFVINVNADPPWDKLDDLREAELKFDSTWKHDRPDLEDKSPSGYEMALADYMALYDWTDQEICDGIACWNRRHKFPLGKLHNDKIRLTIIRARKWAEQEKANDGLETADSLLGTFYYDDAQRKIALDSFAKLWKVKISKIERYVGDEPSFIIYTDKGNVRFPNSGHLISPTKFRKRIFDTTGIYIRNLGDKKKWAKTVQILSDLCIDIIVNPESNEDVETAGWVREYLCRKRKIEKSNIEDYSNHNEDPFVDKGHWFLSAKKFTSSVILGYFKKLEQKDMWNRLKRIGCESVPINLIVNERKTIRNLWKIPLAVADPKDIGEDVKIFRDVKTSANDYDEDEEICIFDIKGYHGR